MAIFRVSIVLVASVQVNMPQTYSLGWNRRPSGPEQHSSRVVSFVMDDDSISFVKGGVSDQGLREYTKYNVRSGRTRPLAGLVSLVNSPE